MKTIFKMLFFTYLLALALSSKTDHINIDEILNNEILYKKYFECLANIGKCTPDGNQLKALLPEALASNCEKCNEKEKEGAEKAFKFMMEHKPDDFSVLEKIYDPDGAYRKKLASEMEKRGVELV